MTVQVICWSFFISRVSNWWNRQKSCHLGEKRMAIFIGGGLLVCFLCLLNVGGQALAKPSNSSQIVSIPLSRLDVDQATATVSVLREPGSPLHTLLGWCELGVPTDFQLEGQNYSEEIKSMCKIVQGVAEKKWSSLHIGLIPKGIPSRFP